jgi:hypothetical protein
MLQVFGNCAEGHLDGVRIILSVIDSGIYNCQLVVEVGFQRKGVGQNFAKKFVRLSC